MPAARESDDSGGVPPKLSLAQRLSLALPRMKRDREKPPLFTRLRDSMVKPVDPSTAKKSQDADRPMTVAELEDAIASADDKERLTGLLLAPVAAAIGLVVSGLKIANARPAFLVNGKVNPEHANLGIYNSLEIVFLALAVLMLATAYFRKRLFLGIIMALYGLSLFNLPPYWGFAFPYILAGAWLLVRAYRLQRDLKVATGEGPARPGSQGRGRGAPTTGRAEPNKRYTPPKPPAKKPRAKKPPSKPDDEKRAG
ncbi:MAG TPA: hypothetical protein VNC61_17750 [Acidimicrobiales bacterium]|nr:hypothetical protein [Acidimicrobiales bacterium]